MTTHCRDGNTCVVKRTQATGGYDRSPPDVVDYCYAQGLTCTVDIHRPARAVWRGAASKPSLLDLPEGFERLILPDCRCGVAVWFSHGELSIVVWRDGELRVLGFHRPALYREALVGFQALAAAHQSTAGVA